MANNKRTTGDFSNRALEMIMRDVLSGMEECLLESAYKNPENAGFEIIEIHPPTRSPLPETDDAADADVIDFPVRERLCR